MISWDVVPRIGIGNFGVSPHGVGIAAGYFAATIFCAKRARKLNYPEDHVWNAATYGVIGAILGARIGYLAGHYNEFDSFLEWFAIWRGGISLIGGLIGGILAGYLYTRRAGIDFFEIADMCMPGLALGIAVGRTGDLVIGDHLGKETSKPWGWEYRGGELISPPPCTYSGTPDGCIAPGMVVHQTALYDMLWAAAIFVILLALEKRPRDRGFMFFSWAGLYAAERIVTDFLRVDKHWFGLPLTGSQLTSIAVVVMSAYFLVRFRGAPPLKKAAMDGAPLNTAAIDETNPDEPSPAGKDHEGSS
ncbi:MAG: prolipoprotein diacylglyceryl transferase [Actinomycetota bacterium]